jgi:ComF family protein
VGRRIVCGECIEENRGFEEGHYGFYFEDRLRDALHAFKFQGRKDVGRRLVSLVQEKIAALSPEIDAIVPVPVTEKRLKARGFNQSFIISEEISRIIARPVEHMALIKTKETSDQFTLAKDERRRNIKGVFAVKDPSAVKAKRILLVDDLLTTGYTVREAARVLRRAKARSLTVFALARTPS